MCRNNIPDLAAAIPEFPLLDRAAVLGAPFVDVKPCRITGALRYDAVMHTRTHKPELLIVRAGICSKRNVQTVLRAAALHGHALGLIGHRRDSAIAVSEIGQAECFFMDAALFPLLYASGLRIGVQQQTAVPVEDIVRHIAEQIGSAEIHISALIRLRFVIIIKRRYGQTVKNRCLLAACPFIGFDAPDRLIVRACRGEGHDLFAAFVILCIEPAGIIRIADSEMRKGICLGCLPCTGHGAGDVHIGTEHRAAARNDILTGQRDLLRACDFAVRAGAVIDKRIFSGQLPRIIAAFRPCLTAVLIRHHDRPAVLIEAHRMHAHLMIFRTVVKAGVVDEIPLSVIVMQHRIMTAGHIRPLQTGDHVIRHQF